MASKANLPEISANLQTVLRHPGARRDLMTQLGNLSGGKNQTVDVKIDGGSVQVVVTPMTKVGRDFIESE